MIGPEAFGRQGLRVLVCGGRDYRNRDNVFFTLSVLHMERTIDLLINGAASGADRLSSLWAGYAGVPLAEFRAHWKTMGPSAGPQRNGWMLKFGQPNIVIAFPGGAGTANMVEQALAAGVVVREIE